MQPEFHSGVVTRPLSAILQLAMMGCPALRARGELAAGACAPVLGWDRGGSSSARARAWWGACGTGARGPLHVVVVKMIYHRFNTHEASTRSKPLGSVPHLAYLSSLSLGGRAYSVLSWRIFSLSRFHPSGVPTIGHGKESNIVICVVLNTGC